MRVIAGASALTILLLSPSTGAAQERSAFRPAHLAVPTPDATVAPVVAETVGDDPALAIQRLADRLSARLRPLEDRFRNDRRLRSAGEVAGLGAMALGALRGQHAFTFVGTQALRLGLDKQLTRIRDRSGFVVEPSIGHRAFAISARRTFP